MKYPLQTVIFHGYVCLPEGELGEAGFSSSSAVATSLNLALDALSSFAGSTLCILWCTLRNNMFIHVQEYNMEYIHTYMHTYIHTYIYIYSLAVLHNGMM